MQAKSLFVDHPPLKVVHYRFVEVLFRQPLFLDIADTAEGTIVPRNKFLIDEHIADMVVHGILP